MIQRGRLRWNWSLRNLRCELQKRLERAASLHVAAIEAISFEVIDSIYRLLADTYSRGNSVYIAGNGGSAADAQHIAAELVGRFKKDRQALSAFALTTDTSCLTAIGNDFGFTDIFSRQLEASFRPGDLLWLLSVSGSSSNIQKAAYTAKDLGGNVVLFTGLNCTELINVADVCLIIQSTSTDTVQECHQFAYHFLCDLIEQDC